MSTAELHFLVPGSLRQLTGGYLYDARMVDALLSRGWRVDVHELSGVFPQGDHVARKSLVDALASLPDNARVLVDGLLLGGLSKQAEHHWRRLRVIVLVHHPVSKEPGLPSNETNEFLKLEMGAYKMSVGVIVTSAYTARILIGAGVEPSIVRIANPGTDSAELAVGPGSELPPQLLTVASVIPRKGHDVLVRALYTIRQFSWSWVCVGSLERDLGFAEKVQELVAECGISDRVTFTGECDRETLERSYARSSIFVLPSYYEGFGMVLTEAISRGLPIVSTDAGAIRETVPSKACLLVPPGDVEALSDALGSLLDRDASMNAAPRGGGGARRRLLSDEARRCSNMLPTWATAAARLEEGILSLVPE